MGGHGTIFTGYHLEGRPPQSQGGTLTGTHGQGVRRAAPQPSSPEAARTHGAQVNWRGAPLCGEDIAQG